MYNTKFFYDKITTIVNPKKTMLFSYRPIPNNTFLIKNAILQPILKDEFLILNEIKKKITMQKIFNEDKPMDEVVYNPFINSIIE
jgi:hypothetical protein